MRLCAQRKWARELILGAQRARDARLDACALLRASLLRRIQMDKTALLLGEATMERCEQCVCL